jgi:hypothetical protein
MRTQIFHSRVRGLNVHVHINSYFWSRSEGQYLIKISTYISKKEV